MTGLTTARLRSQPGQAVLVGALSGVLALTAVLGLAYARAVGESVQRTLLREAPAAARGVSMTVENAQPPAPAELLQRLTDNVSFAIGTFDRADEKARTESQKERLTRMFAALSRTNEAIMRAKSRTELFDLVCEAAADGGRFTSTTIALKDSTSDLLRIVAASGPAARKVRLSSR